MKKILYIIIVVFILSCKKENIDFKSFEISYTDGWTRSCSFIVYKNGVFEFNENFGERKGGKLSIEEFGKLQSELLKLERNNLKSKIENCVDCPIISINIERDNKSSKVVQKSKIDSELIDIEKTIDKILKGKKTYFLKPIYFYKTEKDIAPTKPIFIKRKATANSRLERYTL